MQIHSPCEHVASTPQFSHMLEESQCPTYYEYHTYAHNYIVFLTHSAVYHTYAHNYGALTHSAVGWF